MISVWRGLHSAALLDLVQNSWEKEELLILCPPGLQDFRFVDLLPEGSLHAVGDWSDAQTSLPARTAGIKAPQYPDRPVLGVFTSGTVSGIPRLVLYSRRNLLSSLTGIRSFFDPTRVKTLFCYPQPFHTFGLVLGYVHAAVHGLKLVTGEGRYSRSFHQRRLELREMDVLTLGTPTHFHDLISYVKAEGAALAPSYSCILGGAKVSVPLWYSVRDTLHIEAPSIGYGATEACPGVSHQPPGFAPKEEGEIGHPIPGVYLRFLSDKGLEFTGPNVCLAILQGDHIEFPEKILLHDQIRYRADGILIYEGRTDLMLNRGGHKFSLEKIEDLLRTKGGVESVCVPVPDERLGEELGILIRAQEGIEISDRQQKERLYALLKSELGQAFGQNHFARIDSLPLNGSAKVDRKRVALVLAERG